MHNLAYKADADTYIRRELERARIPIQVVEPTNMEVPYTLIGRLGDFTFTRAWYYWVANGPVPLHVAAELYADPVGITDIRAAGNCMCPSPATVATWLLPDGREVAPADQESKCNALMEQYPDTRQAFDKYVFSDYPVGLGAKQFVSLYHIDTELGLRIFADAVKAYDLEGALMGGG